MIRFSNFSFACACRKRQTPEVSGLVWIYRQPRRLFFFG